VYTRKTSQTICLGGDHGGLLLGIRDNRLGLDVGFGSSREVLLLDGGADVGGSLGGRGGGASGLGRGGAAAEELLSLGSVVTHVLLGDVGGLGGVLAGDGAELVRLLGDDLAGAVELGVNEFLVGGVQEGDHEESSSGDQGKAPEGNDLDEVVGDEGADESSSRNTNVLSEDDALSLNDEKVDELVDVSYGGIERLSGDDEVTSGAELGSEAVAEDELAGKLCKDGGAKHHPGKLQAVSQNIEVAGSEDEGNDGAVGDSRSTRVVPRDKLREEGVVVRQGLASGSGVRGRSASGGKVTELGGSLCGLVLNTLSDGTVRDLLVGSGSVVLGGLDVAVAVGRGSRGRRVREVRHCGRWRRSFCCDVCWCLCLGRVGGRWEVVSCDAGTYLEARSVSRNRSLRGGGRVIEGCFWFRGRKQRVAEAEAEAWRRCWDKKRVREVFVGREKARCYDCVTMFRSGSSGRER